MKTRIEARWKALAPALEKPIFQLLDAEHPLKLYIGREITGEYLFLLVGAEKPPMLKSMRSLQIKPFERPDGEWGLLLTLVRPELSGIFSLLCEDLAASSRFLPSGSSGMGFVSRRLASWRVLLEQGGTGLLSQFEIRGLFGELCVLDRYLIGKVGLMEVVKAWAGPLGADQDFQLMDEAYEVKTIHPDGTSVLIASEKQLWSGIRKLYLVVLTLGEGADSAGVSLNGLVSRLRSKLSNDFNAIELFEERLSASGYIFRDEYEAPLFKLINARMFSIERDFPRITPEMIPIGVYSVKYELFLNVCESYEVECPISTD
jgi:hypothetical protein